MGRSTLELIIILILTLVNGFFAGSEIALISVRKTKIDELIKKGNKRAKIVKNLQSDPEKLIATTQIGISVITTLASVFAGVSLSEDLSPYFESSSIDFVAQHAASISFIIIVAFVSYITLVLGELVPKSLAIRYSERFALFVAYPVWWLSKLCSLLIKFLTLSSNIVLKPFRDSTSFSESKLSEEEIRHLIFEGRKAGTIERREHEILENVFEFSDMTVGKIMTPAAQITAFDIDEATENNITKIIDSEYSRLPFYKSNLDNIIGILHIKDLFAELGHEKKPQDIKLRELLKPAFFVPNTQKISSLLQKFQKNKTHIAIVTDEHGEVDGLVTMEDVLEEIVGDISDETDEIRREIIKQPDGSFIVEGGTSIVDFNRYFKSNLPENEQYTTLSGFILHKLERFPETDDIVEFEDLKLKIKEKTNRTVKFIQLSKKIA